MVADVVESDGTCTLEATRGSVRLAVSGSTTPGPASTYCALMRIPAEDLDPGEWDLAVSYKSPSHSGRSQTMTLDVP
jgi:hypothetical protein